MRGTEPPCSSKTIRRLSSPYFLAAVLALGATLRLVHVLELRSLPLFDRLILDSEYYDNWAQHIAAGEWMGGDRAFFVDPLYSYALAFLYRAVGRDLLLLRLIQAALGIATCGLVAAIGRRVGGIAVGNLAALFVAVYKPAIFQEGEVEKTALGVFLVTVALALAVRTSLKSVLGAGIVLGLAVLARGNLLALAPFGAMYFFFGEDGERGPGDPVGHTPQRWRDRMLGKPGRSAMAFLLGFAAALAPVALRNHHVSGEWIVTTASAGANFYIGNNPANHSGGFQNVPFVRPQSMNEEDDFRAEAQARTGRRLGAGELSTFWFREALGHMAEHPGFAVSVAFRKFVLFWSDLELPDAWDMNFLARYSVVMALPLLGMGLLAPLAALGTISGLGERRGVLLLAGYVAIYSATLIGFFVFSRFRLHAVPALAVLASLGVFRIYDLVRRRDVRAGVLAAVVIFTVGLFSFLGMRGFGLNLRKTESLQSFVSLAGMYQERGDFESAERLLREALAKDPRQPMTLCAMGSLLLGKNDAAGAVVAFHRCIEERPSYPDAWYLLGISYEALGNTASAVAAFIQQLETVPGHREAELRLAEYSIRTGALAKGIDSLTKIAAMSGGDPQLNLTLAVALAASGRTEESRTVLGRSAARGWPSSQEEFDRERARLFGSRRQ